MKNLRLIILLFLIASCGKVLKTHVKGKVLNPVTGQGIENVRVILQKSGSGIPSGLKTVEAVYTDAGGNFDISARTLKGLTASVVLDVNEYYSIGWQKDGEVYSILSPKKGNVTNADFHAVPFGDYQISIINNSCNGVGDTIVIIAQNEVNSFLGNEWVLGGCVNKITAVSEVPMGNIHTIYTVKKLGVTTVYETDFMVQPGQLNVQVINY